MVAPFATTPANGSNQTPPPRLLDAAPTPPRNHPAFCASSVDESDARRRSAHDRERRFVELGNARARGRDVELALKVARLVVARAHARGEERHLVQRARSHAEQLHFERLACGIGIRMGGVGGKLTNDATVRRACRTTTTTFFATTAATAAVGCRTDRRTTPDDALIDRPPWSVGRPTPRGRVSEGSRESIESRVARRRRRRRRRESAYRRASTATGA